MLVATIFLAREIKRKKTHTLHGRLLVINRFNRKITHKSQKMINYGRLLGELI